MTKISLKSKSREEVGKGLNKKRKQGLIPAVIYGHKHKPKNLWVDAADFGGVYSKAGESTIIELSIDEKNKEGVLIHEIQQDPLTEAVTHIDFFQINMSEKIETDIPLNYFGEAAAVKGLGGILVKNVSAIPIRCLPADLPSKIDVNISVLATFDDRISIEDLDVSDKVEILADTHTIVVSVTPPRTEEELAELDEKVEEDVTKVEGIVKETPEGEEAEAGEGAKEEVESEKKDEEKSEGEEKK